MGWQGVYDRNPEVVNPSKHLHIYSGDCFEICVRS